MNLYKITNPKFTGEIEVLYNDLQLLKFDVQNANIDKEVLAAFKRSIPATLAAFLEGSWCGSDTTVVQGTFEVTLDDFTREYPYKRNTHLLPPIWQKMPTIDKIQAVAAAKAYRKYCGKNESWYTPKIAAAWLKNKEYLNDWSKL